MTDYDTKFTVAAEGFLTTMFGGSTMIQSTIFNADDGLPWSQLRLASTRTSLGMTIRVHRSFSVVRSLTRQFFLYNNSNGSSSSRFTSTLNNLFYCTYPAWHEQSLVYHFVMKRWPGLSLTDIDMALSSLEKDGYLKRDGELLRYLT